MMTMQDPYQGYKLIRELRSGGEGKALLMEKDGQKYVCKQRMFETLQEANAGLKEAYSLASIKDVEHIIKFEDVFLSQREGDPHIYICIMTEFCPKGDLLDFLLEFTSCHTQSGSSSNSSSSLTDTDTTTLSLGPNDSQISFTSSDLNDDYRTTTTTTTNNSSSTNSSSTNNDSSTTIDEKSPIKIVISTNNQPQIEKDSQNGTHHPKLNAEMSMTITPPTTEERKCFLMHAKELIKKIKEKPKGSYVVTQFENVSISTSPSQSCSSLTDTDFGFIDKKILIDWLTQLCLGVQTLHREHLIHRDLKCENVFIDVTDNLKIGDFGLATKSSSFTNNQGRVGTYIYSAPEVLSGKAYDRSADIFSLGCIFYELITLKLLLKHKRYFGEEMLEDRFDKIQFLSDFPPQYQHLGPIVLKMVEINPQLRPSIESIIDKLQGTQKLSFKKETMFNGLRKQLYKENNFKEAAGVLGRALILDPRFHNVFPMSPENIILLTKFMKFTLQVMFKRRAQIWGYYGKDGKLQSVSIWQTPDKKKEIKKTDILIGGAKFITKVGFTKTRDTSKIFKTINDIVLNENETKNWFLPYIGTDDAYRNTGVGSYLLEPVLEWADHSSYPCKTLCFSKKVLPFFQRLGFEIDKEIKSSNLPVEAVYIMRREPRKTD